MLTLLVGNATPEIQEDFCDVQRMLPFELVDSFRQWGEGRNWNGVVRIYDSTLLNWVGIEVERKGIDHNAVEIITTHGKHLFDESGIVGKNWPYGIFSYYGA